MEELNFKNIVFIDDDMSYFHRFSSMLEALKLSFYPKEESSFCNIIRLINLWGRHSDKTSFSQIKSIVNHFVNKATVCIVDFQLIEDTNVKYNGLTFYEDFIKGNEKKTIFASATLSEPENNLIKDFCSKNHNCFYVHKPSYYYHGKEKERFESKIKELILE